MHPLLDPIRAVLIAVLRAVSQVGNQWLHPLEARAARFSRHKLLTILSLGVATILIRLALLPVVPVPIPAVHDEFSYLLMADTFAHGRLTNPPHPMWVFFDTFHVLEHPTYTSKYFPAPGLAMALGQILGHPWIGVLLSLSVMTMAMTWMLQGWFSPPWALLGGVLVLLRVGLINGWMESYFGSSIAALGAALVLGAYPRILRSARVRDAVLLGMGAIVLACSRPLEGLIFCVPVGIAILVRAMLKPKPHIKAAFPRVFRTLAIVLGAGLGFLVYYNWRVTHSPLLFPYILYHRQYFNYPVFAWQVAPPPLHYDNPQFEAFFNGWNRFYFPLTWEGWKHRSFGVFWLGWYVYLGPVLTLLLIPGYRVLKDRRMRLPLCQFILCSIGLISVVWFTPNYAAPLAAVVFVLIVQGMRHLRHVKIKDQAIGIFITRLVVLLAVDWLVIQAGSTALHPVRGFSNQRAQVVQELQSLPGRQLVLVRYGVNHNVLREWVYNAADIDAAKIVWAREIPSRDSSPLLEYFKDRRVWLVQADAVPPRIEPYRKQGNP